MGKKPLTDGQKKQIAYSRKRTKWFEKISGRKLLTNKDTKRGRPR